MTRKITLLNIAAICLIIFMLTVTILDHNKKKEGWGIFGLIMAICFSSLLIINDYFIQTKIKGSFNLFIVELLILVVLVGLGILIINI